MRGIQCVPNIFRLNVKAIDVIEPAVPSLGNNRQAPPVAGAIGCAVLNAPRDHRIARYADAVRVCDDNRSFEETTLFDPCGAGHLAISVQAKKSRVNRIVKRSVTARQDRRNAGTHRAFAHFKLSFTTN